MLKPEIVQALIDLEDLLPDTLRTIFQRVNCLRRELIEREGTFLWHYSASTLREDLQILENTIRQFSKSLTPEQEKAAAQAGVLLLSVGENGVTSLERFAVRIARRTWLQSPDLGYPMPSPAFVQRSSTRRLTASDI
jgi:hypothetical protein